MSYCKGLLSHSLSCTLISKFVSAVFTHDLDVIHLLDANITQGRTSPFEGAFELVPETLQPQRIPISIQTTIDSDTNDQRIIPSMHDGRRTLQV